MIFNTYWFALFAAVFFPVYWLLREPALRAVWLLGACIWFHTHFAGPAGVLPIAALGLLTYLCALSRRRSVCYFAVSACVVALICYKYLHFLSAEVLGFFAPQFGSNTAAFTSQWLPALAPLALSFFTFEFVHYLIEVSRGGAPIRHPGKFALFAIYFPSLVAGPIKRYRDFTTELPKGLVRVGWIDVSAGAQRVALGFGKKILLADNLTAGLTFYEKSFSTLTPAGAWLFLGALAARILLDFSGYSDIAIGLSRMLGIRLPENFNHPYAATSLRDFWDRWHISLSTWIRDYIYIPLGGNRLGPARRFSNLVIVFALCGLWHGPAGHFVLWGLWHGLGLVIQVSYRTALGASGRKLGEVFDRIPALGWFVTLLFVAFGWLLFFYPAAQAWAMTMKLLSFR